MPEVELKPFVAPEPMEGEVIAFYVQRVVREMQDWVNDVLLARVAELEDK